MRVCALLLVVSLAGCADEARRSLEVEATRQAATAALIALDTPQSLATATVLLDFKTDPRSRAQRRQHDYLLEESSKPRLFPVNSDLAVRLEAMRNFRSEADVERAMLFFYHEPLERPVHWKPPQPYPQTD